MLLAGAPFEMNPTALYRESLLSSGAITNRIDRVEAQGLVKPLLLDVTDDDSRRTRDTRAAHGVESKASGAEDDDSVAGVHTPGVPNQYYRKR